MVRLVTNGRTHLIVGPVHKVTLYSFVPDVNFFIVLGRIKTGIFKIVFFYVCILYYCCWFEIMELHPQENILIVLFGTFLNLIAIFPSCSQYTVGTLRERKRCMLPIAHVRFTTLYNINMIAQDYSSATTIKVHLWSTLHIVSKIDSFTFKDKEKTVN